MLQTGEYDYAWNMQVEDEVLKRMEEGGKGSVVIVPGGNIELIQLNSPTLGTRSMASAPASRPSIRF